VKVFAVLDTSHLVRSCNVEVLEIVAISIVDMQILRDRAHLNIITVIYNDHLTKTAVLELS